MKELKCVRVIIRQKQDYKLATNAYDYYVLCRRRVMCV